MFEGKIVDGTINMQNMELEEIISVIIPCYNVADYVVRCLNSVTNQSFNNIKIYVIDDKSTDNTLEILKKYKSIDNRVHLISLPINSGVSYARNIGLSMAKGKYVSFIDPDDYIDEDYIEQLYNIAQQSDADIVKGRAKNVRNINSLVRNNKLFFYAQWWSAIYKTNLIKQNNISFKEDVFCGQDFVFQRHACLCANMVAVSDEESFYYYQKRPNSLDSKYFPIDKIKSQLKAREYIVGLANKYCLTDVDYKIIIERLISEIEWLWQKTQEEKSRMLICKKYIELYKQLSQTSFLKTKYHTLTECMQAENLQEMYEHLSVYFYLYKYQF